MCDSLVAYYECVVCVIYKRCLSVCWSAPRLRVRRSVVAAAAAVVTGAGSSLGRAMGNTPTAGGGVGVLATRVLGCRLGIGPGDE